MQSNLINVPSTVKDPMYRYKMPQMKLKIEGRGNGIKTNIVNMPEVAFISNTTTAFALNLRTDYPLRFLAYELGSQVNYQAGSETICIINGEFTLEQMQKNLDKFIRKYVCCSKCTLPEVTMKVIGDKLKGDCRSCGHQALLDNKHRIATYIVKLETSSQGGNLPDTDLMHKSGTAVKKRKLLILGDQELKDFRGKISEAGFPLDTKHELIAEIQKVYTIQFAKVRAEDKVTPVRIIEKAYKNLKTLKIPRDKQMLYGYFIFNALFTKNVGNQIREHGKLVKDLWERTHRTPQLEHELLILLSDLLFTRFQETDFTKFIPLMFQNFINEGLLRKEFLAQWAKGERDATLAEHFLFSREKNEKLKVGAKPILDSLLDVDEESSDSKSSGSKSDSGSESGSGSEDSLLKA